MSLFPIDGPAVYGALSVTSASAVEVKVGGSPLDERKVITIQPTNGHVYFGYSNSVTTSTGTKIFKNQIYPIEASEKLAVYIIAETGTVNVRITEAS